MANYVKVASVSEFEDGAIRKVTAGGQEIMLARVGSNYYAINSRCPHMGGDLSMGKLEGTVITCPRHGSQFDIKNGRNLRWMKGSGLAYSIGKTLKQPQPVKTYPVKIVGGDITIEI
jgi:3-phenylpropionate/trans-cinnamate dioxygenase ferredoxin component